VQNGESTFNEQMVLAGYATIYRHFMTSEELPYFENLLKSARKSRLGLWQNHPGTIECLDHARR